jgi:hypothetical protein
VASTSCLEIWFPNLIESIIAFSISRDAEGASTFLSRPESTIHIKMNAVRVVGVDLPACPTERLGWEGTVDPTRIDRAMLGSVLGLESHPNPISTVGRS